MNPLVLIVDDHVEIRKLLRITLSTGGYKLLEADNGRAALDMALASKPSLVLLDVMMPGDLDGFRVCEKIKSDPSLMDTKVILLTARGQRTDLETGMQAGADAYLTKPFSPLELLDTIGQLLGNHE